MSTNDRPDNCLFVIFGASGDLTKRKLIPSLYHLDQMGQVPASYGILGVARSSYSDDEYRHMLFEFSRDSYDAERWGEFSQRIHYLSSDATRSDNWAAIRERYIELSRLYQTEQNVLFYLSLSPEFFEPVIINIGESELVSTDRRPCPEDGRCWQRIVVEKPFGSDPTSAARLNQTLARVFDEESIYRIDHYLGKELVQNIMVLRFANSLFEPLWNQRYIDHVQITATETVGLEGRASYYDGPAGGALRDMVQSHLLQVLSVIAMEPPVTMDAAAIRTEKIKIFQALRVPAPRDVPRIAVRGQYAAGTIGGEPVPGYRENEGVGPDSQTDTYAAMRAYVDTWRWGGVPFYLRSGKAMKRKKTEIVLYFKSTPHCLFREHARKMKPNQIVINIQPNEGIRVRFVGKVPGLGMNIKDVVMDFDYVEQWKINPPESYATLLYDAIEGDQTLFKHRDEIERGWNAVQPILDYWRENPDDDLPNYDAGTWGPVRADAMMAREDRYWRND